jgi:hypothetical protein
MRFSHLCLPTLVIAAACEPSPSETPPVGAATGTNVGVNAPGLTTPTIAGDAAKPGDPGVQLANGSLPADVTLPAGVVLPAGLVLPAGWQGLGVLANPPDAVPKKAPAWARSLAEVVARGGKHFLETTGRADRIKNPALARSTAENRARAEMAKWLATERMTMAQATEMFIDKKSKAMFVRVAIEVPEGWYPGQPAVGETPTARTPPAPAVP